MATNNVITALNGARIISKSISDKDILDRFLHDFSPTYDSLMRDKSICSLSARDLDGYIFMIMMNSLMKCCKNNVLVVKKMMNVL